MEETVLSQEPVETSTNDSDDLFGDLVDSMPEETEETPVVEETPKPFLKVKYNKEDRDLTEDEARDFAEKGMNYDKLRDKYNGLNDRIEYLAKKNGMDVDAFIDSLNQTQVDYEIQKEFEDLKEKYPDTEDEVLEELARSRVDGRYSKNILNEQKVEAEQSDARSQEAKRQIDAFLNEYPDKRDDLLNDRIDPVVYEYVKQGMTLLEAYSKYERQGFLKEREARENQDKIAKQNEENKKKSLGNLTNVEAPEGENDFFAGMDSI